MADHPKVAPVRGPDGLVSAPPDISGMVKRYPELAKFEGTRPAWAISAIYLENAVVAEALGDVRDGKPTVDIAYAQQNLARMLGELPNDPALDGFRGEQSAIHKKHQGVADVLLRGKERGVDGVYRAVVLREYTPGDQGPPPATPRGAAGSTTMGAKRPR